MGASGSRSGCLIIERTNMQTIEQINAARKRWKSRLKRAINALDKLDRQEKRLQAKLRLSQKMVAEVFAEEKLAQPEWPAEGRAPSRSVKPVPDPDPIPDFLRREAEGRHRDQIAADTIRKEQAERKKLKAHNRIAEMKAKKSGATKRMPLEGKAALAAIKTE